MSSRLDRLFVLLENGGSDATRQAAALQLGEIVKLHPHELSNLLSKLKLFLSSKSWETRIAAGQAVSAILSNVPPWDPQPQTEDIKSENEPNLKNNGQLSLETFSIKRVLEKGSYLFAADEQDFDMEENLEFAPNSKEAMAHQRNLINQKLGLDVAESLGINTQNIFSASDLTTEISLKGNSKSTVGEVFQEELDSVGLQMSSRERNKAKRKAKHISQKKKSLSDSTDISCDETSERKRLKISDGDKSDDGELLVNEKLNSQEESWPLEQFAEHVSQDLFNCSWEVRHGAGTALRELIRLHGLGVGKRSSQTYEQMYLSHKTWLEDKALRIICVLALDRFGDFLADQVVAPVRETCAQVLGCIVKYLSDRSIFAIWHQLQEMITWSDWETRHGGFLGLKYLLAVREDLREKLLPNSYQYIFKGLKDELDDVVAVAATCLVPVSDDLIHFVTLDVINELLHVLSKTLLDIDDLSASTNSILLLISKLLSYNRLLDRFDGNLCQLICRLWPFLYHSSSSVRSSTLKTIYILVDKFCSSSDLPTKTSSVEPLNSYKETLVEKSAKNLDISNLCLQSGSKEITENWLENVLEPLLNHTFQRGLLENVAENLNLIEKIWNLTLKNTPLSNLLVITCRRLPSWLCLMMTNSRMALDTSLMLFDFNSKCASMGKSLSLKEEERKDFSVDDKYFLGGSRDGEEDIHKIEENIIRARCCIARLLGNLSNFVSQPMPCVEYHENETPILCYIRLLNTHLNSRTAAQRLSAALIAREWAIQYPQTSCHQLLYSNLLKCLQEYIYFDEISWQISRLQQESKDFLNALQEHNIGVDSNFFVSPYLSFEQIENLCDSSNWIMKNGNNSVSEVLISQNKSLMKNLGLAVAEQNKLNVSVQSVIAGALVHFKCLPEKLNPLIKPLMESMKKETNEQLQIMASVDLTSLLELCMERQPSPNSKIVKNLASFLCADEAFTPNILNNHQNESTRIYTLANQIKSGNSYRTNSTTGRGPGRPPLRQISSASSDSNDSMLDLPRETEVKNKSEKEVQRRGCTFALQEIAKHFGLELEEKLPYLINMIFEPLENPPKCEDNDREDQQNIINWLQMIEVLMPVLNQNILNKFNSVLSSFDSWIYHPNSGIRHMGSRVFAVCASVSTRTSMDYMIENIVPNLDVMQSDYQRLGALEALHLAIEKLGFFIVPYIVLLIVPLLGSMSDPLEEIRHLGAQCFATLIRLYPLDGGSNDAMDISPGLCAKKKNEKLFLERLLDPTKIENYQLPVPINATLRSYQQKGINWLAFLRKFNLHGILCDDMGLGKTLQSICILAGDHYEKEKNSKENKKKICAKPSKLDCQSLVVCPPTLTGHWYYEISKFISKDFLDPLHYTGPPFERKRLQNYFDSHNLIIASYKIVRNEIGYFSKRKWNYIILDEGHTIKNGKTKSSKAIKELVCNHRLILTGTPIQNNVLELWSLFDFLMPGFLGTEKQFMSKYSKPIILSKEAKSSKEQKEGVLAMESLHRQILPFIMRRVKEDVLKDLPPKIVQDYYCDLSPLQVRLYEDFAKTRSNQMNSPNNEEKKKPYPHIFQALQYLRRVCNHPKLALLPSHPQYEAVIKQIKDSKSSLSDISHSAKLPALKQLLLDCGIGVSKDDANIATTSVISPHRALIFCQLKGMLDIIEKDLLKVHLPSVTYLRLDGSVVSNQRYDLIHRFNTDPSIDLLLLTTQVGGLGLNLTGADTVIFVEHDWNPMRDLQAMDRAHRIGQKRVVNVYRLVTKGTMEEKIMSLQKFKLLTANKVITQENSSLLSMGTDQLLELFTLDSKNQPNNNPGGSKDLQTLGLPVGGIKKAIESLPDLWEQSLYEEEYNFDSYLQTLAQ